MWNVTNRIGRGLFGAVAIGLALVAAVPAMGQDGDKLNIIVFGAHPDDAELKVGGTAAKWAALGHRVKFVSVTNGDIGHFEMAGGPLALRRAGEVEASANVLGIEVEVLDNHDGELLPTLEVRKVLIKLMREWKADLVISHRPNDYHPDHRYTGVLVQDAAFMVTVPFIVPETPRLEKNPVFMYMWDHFQKPNPIDPAVFVPIDDTIETKLEALSLMTSQFAEWAPWHVGRLNEVPADDAGKKEYIKNNWRARYDSLTARYTDELKAIYGREAENIAYIEAFELCEYGHQPTREELARLFPFAKFAKE